MFNFSASFDGLLEVVFSLRWGRFSAPEWFSKSFVLCQRRSTN